VTVPVRAPRPKHYLLRRVLAYSASRGVTEGLLGVRGIVLAALLGPAAFGLWALVRLSMRYATMVPLSVFRGLELELLAAPSPAGRLATAGKPAEGGDAPARVALGFVLAATGALATATVAASFLVRDPAQALVLRGFAAAIVFEQVYGYVLVCTRLRQDLRRYAILETLHAGLQVVCVVALAWAGGLEGAFAGLALASLLAIIIGGRQVELRPAFRWGTLRRLLREGIPLALNMILTTALSTADRWIVAGFGGVTMLGYYAFAAQVASVSVTFAWVIRTVIFPDVYRNARATPARVAPALRAHLERAVLPFARIFPPLLGAASLVVGPVLAFLLPHYAAAVGPARIFLLAGTAGGIVSLASIGVVAAGKQRRLPLLSGAALAVNLSLSFLAVGSGAGLEFVAAASFVGQTVFAAGVLSLTARASGIDDVRPLLVRALTPLAWCVALVVVVGLLLPAIGIGSTALALALYLVLLAPLVPAMRADWRRVTA
jgi:O-antigen/teichoic acid export membrane protein